MSAILKKLKKKKKNKLNENIKCLQDIYNNIENSINELKKIFESVNENKEEVKMKIAEVFTTIRNPINEREDELLLEVDSQFNNLFFKEEIVNKSEKLPNEIKLSLEKGKLINNEWNNNDSDKLKFVN